MKYIKSISLTKEVLTDIRNQKREFNFSDWVDKKWREEKMSLSLIQEELKEKEAEIKELKKRIKDLKVSGKNTEKDGMKYGICEGCGISFNEERKPKLEFKSRKLCLTCFKERPDLFREIVKAKFEDKRKNANKTN